MHAVTYSMGMSLDGFVVGPDGTFDWSDPDPEVFELSLDELRRTHVHLLGRNLYETMRYWETAEQEHDLNPAEIEWADRWNRLPKLVFSRTLTSVDPSARLADGDLVQEIERLRTEPGRGDIAIGGPTLAAQAAAFDLIDEYRVRVYPVLVGGGLPFIPRDERRVDLELIETRTFNCGIVYLRQRVRH